LDLPEGVGLLTEEANKFIAIGKIVNTQGNRGEVRVIPLTDFPERFADTERVYLQQGGRFEIRLVEKTYQHKKFIIVKFAGVNDMNAGEALKGALVMIPREELMPLPEDTFYIFDIVGLEVVTTEGRSLGHVKEVLQTGANDVYVVEGNTRRPLLIPALKKVVLRVDTAEKRMTVELPEGLEETQ